MLGKEWKRVIYDVFARFDFLFHLEQFERGVVGVSRHGFWSALFLSLSLF